MNERTASHARGETPDYERDRQRHVQAMISSLPGDIEMVAADRETVTSLQTQQFRALVAHAKAHSPWHRERLAHVDPKRLTASRINELPPMTKGEMMANWDGIVCDPRLTLDVANKHLKHISETGPGYLLDDYHVLATGGSTGERGVVVWDFDGFLLQGMRPMAWQMWLSANGHPGPAFPLVIANATSQNPVHLGGAFFACLRNDTLMKTTFIPATLPMEEIARCVEALKPTVLVGYPSICHELARRKRAGALDLAPQLIEVGGEPLLPEAVTAIKQAFGDGLRNTWGATEIGPVATTFPGRDEMFVADDLVIIEPVDVAGNPVAYGERSAKVFVTNLINKVMPLIRYEITDEMVVLPPDPSSPWQGTRIKEVLGRTDDPFRYPDGTFVHPHPIRSALTKTAAVGEYQVRQTTRGAHVLLRADGQLDAEAVARAVQKALAGAGLADPIVTAEIVNIIARHGVSGKLKRFVQLS